jgi:hypothetical protein
MKSNAHSIESIIFEQLDSAGNKCCAESWVGNESKVTVLRVRPATDGQENFECSGAGPLRENKATKKSYSPMRQFQEVHLGQSPSQTS